MRYTVTSAAHVLGVTREQLLSYIQNLEGFEEKLDFLEEYEELDELDQLVPTQIVDAIFLEHTGYSRDDLYTVPELARELDVSPATIYYRVKQGTIPSVTIGTPPSHRTYVPKEGVQKLVKLYNKDRVQSAIQRAMKQADSLVRELKQLSHSNQDSILQYIRASIDGESVRFVNPSEQVIVLEEEGED